MVTTLVLPVLFGYASLALATTLPLTIPLNPSLNRPSSANLSNIAGQIQGAASIADRRAAKIRLASASSLGPGRVPEGISALQKPSLEYVTWQHIKEGETIARSVYDRASLFLYSGKNPQSWLSGDALFYDYRYPQDVISISSKSGSWNTPKIIANNHLVPDNYSLTGSVSWGDYATPEHPDISLCSLAEARTAVKLYADRMGCRVDLDNWEVYAEPLSETLFPSAVIAFPASGPIVDPSNPKIIIQMGYFTGRPFPAGVAPRWSPPTDTQQQEEYDLWADGVQANVHDSPDFGTILVSWLRPNVMGGFGSQEGYGIPNLRNSSCYTFPWDGPQTDYCFPKEAIPVNLDQYQPFNYTATDPSKGMANVSTIIQTFNEWNLTTKADITLDIGLYEQFRPSDSFRATLGPKAKDDIYYRFNARSSTIQNGTILVNSKDKNVFFTSAMKVIPWTG